MTKKALLATVLALILALGWHYASAPVPAPELTEEPAPPPSSTVAKQAPAPIAPTIPKPPAAKAPAPSEAQAFRQPSPTKIARLVEAATWEGGPSLPEMPKFTDPAFDKWFMEEDVGKRRADNPWRERTFYPVSGGFFDAVLVSLANPDQKDIVYVDLEKAEIDGVSWLYPASLRYRGPGPDWHTEDYSGWRSPFFPDKTYIGSLHFPYNGYWKAFFGDDKNCQEVLVIYLNLISSTHDTRHTDGFDGPVYCRQGEKKLTRLGFMSFSHNLRP